MPPWAEILDELRALRRSMDKIAAIVTGEQAKLDLHPVWRCGHRHPTRGEAVACLATAAEAAADSRVPAEMRYPVACGHQHDTLGEAVDCLRWQEATGEPCKVKQKVG